jgi:aminopeptidase C
MKKSLVIFAITAAMVMTGCGRIGTGNAGLRIEANGTTSQKVEGEGFYTSILSHVDQYTMKEVAVNLENMTPKAKDNLSLKELDVTVFYKVKSANALRELAVNSANRIDVDPCLFTA